MGARLLQPGHQMRSASGGKRSVKAARQESGSHAEGARGGRDGRRGALARLGNTCSLSRRVRDRRELTVTLETEVVQLFPLLLPRNQQEDSDEIPSPGSYLLPDSRASSQWKLYTCRDRMLHAVSRYRSNAAVMSLNALIVQPSDAGLHPNPVYSMCIFPEYEHSREKPAHP